MELDRWWRDLRQFAWGPGSPFPPHDPFSRLHRWIGEVEGPGWPPPPPTAGMVARAQRLLAELGLTEQFEGFQQRAAARRARWTTTTEGRI